MLTIKTAIKLLNNRMREIFLFVRISAKASLHINRSYGKSFPDEVRFSKPES